MEMMLWNIALTAVLGLVGYILKEKAAELARITILLNKTREEIAKEYVTKVDVHLDINRVLDRLDRMESKLDDFIRTQQSAFQ